LWTASNLTTASVSFFLCSAKKCTQGKE
jgi:hypothetical protein